MNNFVSVIKIKIILKKTNKQVRADYTSLVSDQGYDKIFFFMV